MIDIRTTRSGFALDTRQRFELPLQEVFAFFADPRNLQTITPPWVRFEILTNGALVMKKGLLIDYAIRVHGVGMKWHSEITVWDPPHRFADMQRKGPYHRWIHEHTFEADEGGTVARDHVDYDVPGGRLIHALFVRRNLQRIFGYRQERLAELLRGDTP